MFLESHPSSRGSTASSECWETAPGGCLVPGVPGGWKRVDGSRLHPGAIRDGDEEHGGTLWAHGHVGLHDMYARKSSVSLYATHKDLDVAGLSI